MIASDLVIWNIFLIIILVILIILGIKTFSKTDSWKKFFDQLFLKLPLVWSVYKNYIIAQIASNLWLLIWAWIPIVKTLRLTWEASNNIIYNQALDIITERVSSWKKLTQSIDETDPEHIYFPNDFVQIIWAWERTSTVNKICEKIHKQYTREVEYSINNLIKWIEPLAILVAWIFVLWFAFAIFSAVLKITETVS
jgi:type IV pilus assembly protein PilC